MVCGGWHRPPLLWSLPGDCMTDQSMTGRWHFLAKWCSHLAKDRRTSYSKPGQTTISCQTGSTYRSCILSCIKNGKGGKKRKQDLTFTWKYNINQNSNVELSYKITIHCIVSEMQMQKSYCCSLLIKLFMYMYLFSYSQNTVTCFQMNTTYKLQEVHAHAWNRSDLHRDQLA